MGCSILSGAAVPGYIISSTGIGTIMKQAVRRCFGTYIPARPSRLFPKEVKEHHAFAEGIAFTAVIDGQTKPLH
ncbi:MAG: hypothetical protein ACLTDS_11225 [Bianqueaceae bacterium]